MLNRQPFVIEVAQDWGHSFLDAVLQQCALSRKIANMPDTPETTRGAELIRAERVHQIAVGYDATHDLQHGEGDSALTAAALCYAIASDGASLDPSSDQVLMFWPWELDQFKPSEDGTRNLIIAGALIAAEIDRRLAAAGVPDALAPLSPIEAEMRHRQAVEATIHVLEPGSEMPVRADHVHDVGGWCLADRGGKCTAPKAFPSDTCPKCRHRAHGSWCPPADRNMASDNCSCTHVTIAALGKRISG